MTASPSVLHSFLAILAGFVTIVVLIAFATFALKRFAPELSDNDTPASPLAMVVNLLLALAVSFAGGFVTARAAGPSGPLIHALMLAFVVLLLGAFSVVQMRGKQRLAYLLLLTALPPAAVVLGGLARLYQAGVRW